MKTTLNKKNENYNELMNIAIKMNEHIEKIAKTLPQNYATYRKAAKLAGYKVVSAYTNKGYKVPDNCVVYSPSFNPNENIYVLIENTKECPMMAININDSHQDFTDEILKGIKTIETRKTHSLRPYIGKRVGICRTGKSKSMLVGYATISNEIYYTCNEHFERDYKKHRVSNDSIYFGGSYGYVLTDVVPCDKVILNSRGIVARKIEM